MALAAGTRLGPYEIVSPLGVGGMGEVYRARDSRLHRLVALKVIAPRVIGGEQARERFEREARAIAALSPSHICTLYDIGAADGVEFLVMEHLEGETLAARLARHGSGNPLPLEETLRIATELADALAAAHRAGIVHRDLKPANIMLARPGGSRHDSPQVKVLDFGLAKLREPHASREQTTTVTTALTGEGAFVGTLPYMAPEQLEGREADPAPTCLPSARSFTRWRAAAGPSRANRRPASSQQSSIAIPRRSCQSSRSHRQDSTAWSASALRRVLTHDGRAPAMWTMGLDWHPRTNHVLLLTLDDAGMSTIWRVPPDGQEQVRLFEGHDVRAICSSPASDVVYALRHRGPASDLLRVSMNDGSTVPDVLLSGLPIGDIDFGLRCSVTTDGRRLLYLRGANRSNLWRLDLTGVVEATQLTYGTRQLWLPDVSPDGQWIAATAGPEASAEIVKLPIGGGEPVRLVEGVGPVWSPNGRTLAFVSTRGGSPRMWLVSADGGGLEEVKDSAVGNPLPAWLPDGRLGWPTPDARNYRIRDLRTGADEMLVKDDSVGWIFKPRFSPVGNELALEWNRQDKGKPGLWLITWPGREERYVAERLAPVGWSADGNWIYAIPHAGRSVVRVSPRTGTIEDVGRFSAGSFREGGSCVLTRDRASMICGLLEQVSDAWLMRGFDPDIR